MRETWVQSLGREDSLEKEIATHSSTLAQKIPWTEEPGAGNCPWGRKESDTISKGNLFKRECLQESSGGLVVRTLSSQSQQSRFDPWSELRSFMAWSKKKKVGENAFSSFKMFRERYQPISSYSYKSQFNNDKNISSLEHQLIKLE